MEIHTSGEIRDRKEVAPGLMHQPAPAFIMLYLHVPKRCCVSARRRSKRRSGEAAAAPRRTSDRSGGDPESGHHERVGGQSSALGPNLVHEVVEVDGVGQESAEKPLSLRGRLRQLL